GRIAPLGVEERRPARAVGVRVATGAVEPRVEALALRDGVRVPLERTLAARLRGADAGPQLADRLRVDLLAGGGDRFEAALFAFAARGDDEHEREAEARRDHWPTSTRGTWNSA